jgi:hypothetical protein
MVLDWMHNLIGQWGLSLSAFYNTNSLWINLLVLVYGTWVILAWSNLKNIRMSLLQTMIKQLRSQPDLPSSLSPEEALPHLEIPWESAIHASRFPFIAHQFTLIPRRLSIESVQALLPGDYLTGEALRIIRLKSPKKTG